MPGTFRFIQKTSKIGQKFNDSVSVCIFISSVVTTRDATWHENSKPKQVVTSRDVIGCFDITSVAMFLRHLFVLFICCYNITRSCRSEVRILLSCRNVPLCFSCKLMNKAFSAKSLKMAFDSFESCVFTKTSLELKRRRSLEI